MGNSNVIFQAFKWDARHEGKIGNWYNLLLSKIDAIKSANFDFVWFPPSSKSRSQDWVGYTPMDYYDLGEFRQWVQNWNGHNYEWKQQKSIETLYGTKQQLKKVIKKLNERDIRSIADIVINHRDPQQVNYYGEPVSWGGPLHKIASKKMVWGDSSKRPVGAEFWDNDRPEEIATWYGGGSKYSDDGEIGFSSNLAHENPEVRKQITDWLNWMKNEIGFAGWRYDFVKGYEPSRVKEYNLNTAPSISIGEYYDGDVTKIKNWISKTGDDYDSQSQAFDFPLQSHLRQIFYGAKSFEQLGLWKMHPELSLIKDLPGKAVTFLDNHDTIRTAENNFPLDDKRLIQGHVFLLTHPGTPCVFWSHLFERNTFVFDQLIKLTNLRKTLGLTNSSAVEIVEWQTCYVAKIDDHVLVKIGDNAWTPPCYMGSWNKILEDPAFNSWTIWTK